MGKLTGMPQCLEAMGPSIFGAPSWMLQLLSRCLFMTMKVDGNGVMNG